MYAIQCDIDQKLIPLFVRHAAWLITHFQIKADGKTPYERLRNRAQHGEVELSEAVHHEDPAKDVGKMDDKWHVGVWLGKSMASDEHHIGTNAGAKLCRSIWRRPRKARWAPRTLDEFVGDALLQRSMR